MSRQQAIKRNAWTVRAAPVCLTKSVRCCTAAGPRPQAPVPRVGRVLLGQYLVSTLAENCVCRASKAAFCNFQFSVQMGSICWHAVVLYFLERYVREEEHGFPNQNTLVLQKADER